MLVLDCCREDIRVSVAGVMRAVGGSQKDPIIKKPFLKNSAIVFSTTKGNLAHDGGKSGGPFMAALTAAMEAGRDLVVRQQLSPTLNSKP